MKTETMNRENWTILRKAQYEYLKSKLNDYNDGISVLDLGAGPSPFRDLTKKFKLTSVDWEDNEMVDKVVNLEEDLPFLNNSFDIVIASNVLEHLYYPEKVLFESFRVLGEGGTFLGVVPFLIGVHQNPHDYFRYTIFALKRMLKEAGFDYIEVVPHGTPWDVVIHTQKAFFMKLFGKGKNRLIVKVGWNLLKTYQHIFKFVFKSLLEEEHMCLGYGFMAIKYKKKSES